MHGSKPPRSRKLELPIPAAFPIAAVISFGTFSCALAGPTGGVVVTGRATISTPSAASTVIDQSSSHVQLNWNTFNIGSSESVRFNQPTSTSVAVNRILDQNPSQIFGSLQANGRVVLVNPNGMLFGPTASLNVGSLVASSLDVSGFDPVTGRYSFSSSRLDPGAITNAGTITAANGGSVTLLGGRVTNTGHIVADFGTVNLAAGRAATLDLEGDGLLRLTVDSNLVANSSGADSAVANSGSIQANGGQILLTAQALENVYSNLVNNTGVVRAGRIDDTGGVIRLVGSGGTVISSGTLDASAADSASTGGSVSVLGDHVGLFDNAVVNVSGSTGGGTALIGGDFHGANPDVQNASRTYVGPNAVIDADAGTTGDGGNVVVWSNEVTKYFGSLSARGGSVAGNGGKAEVSGKQLLQFDGTANTSAPHGSMGTLLLDPYNLTIDNGGSNSATLTDQSPADTTYAFATDGTASDGTSDTNIKGTKVNSILADSNLTLEASNDLTLVSGTTISGSNGKTLTLRANDNIALDGIVNMDGALTLEAAHAISLSNSITAASFSASAGTNVGGGGASGASGQNLTLNSAAAFTVAGNTSLSASGDIVVGSGTPTVSGGSVTLSGANIGAVSSFATGAGTPIPVSTTGALIATSTATSGGAINLNLLATPTVAAGKISTTDGAVLVHSPGALDTSVWAAGAIDAGTGTGSQVGLVSGGVLTVLNGVVNDGTGTGVVNGVPHDLLLSASTGFNDGAANHLAVDSANNLDVVTGAGSTTTVFAAVGGRLDAFGSSSHDLVFSASSGGFDVGTISDVGATVTLNAATGGAITNAQTAATAVSAQALVLNADSVGTQGATPVALTTAVNNLAVTTGGTGGINVSNTGSLNVGVGAAGISQTGTGTVVLTTDANSDITLGKAIAAGTNDVNLTAGTGPSSFGSITGAGAITANKLTLAAASVGASGVGNAVSTHVGTLSSTTSTGLYVGNSAGALALSSVNGGTGAVSIDNGTGNITATASISAGALTLGGNQLGTTGAHLATNASSINATGAAGVYIDDSGTGSLGVTASGGTGATQITATNGSIVAGNVSGTGVTLDAQSGGAGITVNGTINGGAAPVSLTAGSVGNRGAINTGTSNAVDGASLTLRAASVGTSASGHALNTQVGTLDSQTSTGLFLANTGVPLALTSLDGGTGAVSIDNTGNNITASGSIGAGSLTLAGNQLGTTGAHLATNASSINATGAAGVVIDDSGTGPIAVTASGGTQAAQITTSNASMTAGNISGNGVTLAAQGAGSNITVNGTINGGASGATLTAGDVGNRGAIIAGTSNSVRGNSLTLTAATVGASGTGNALNTQTSALTATTTGGLYLANTGAALALTSVDGGTGAVSIDNGTTGDLTAPASITAGSLTLVGNHVGTTGSHLATNAGSIDATGQNGVYLDASGTGSINVTASGNAGAASITTSNGSIVAGNVSGNGVTLNENYILGSLTVNGTVDAGAGTANLHSFSSLTEGASGLVKGNDVQLDGGSIGTSPASRFNIQANTLTTNATTQYLAQTGTGNLAINGITTNSAAGTVDLSAAAGLAVDGTVDATTGTVILAAAGDLTGNGSNLIKAGTTTLSGANVGTSGQAINTNAGTLNLTLTGSGTRAGYVNDSAATTILATAQGGAGGSVNVTTQGALTVGTTVTGSNAALTTVGAGNNIDLTGGAISVTGNAGLNAGGAIIGGGATALTAGTASVSGTSIGSSGTPLNLAVNSLTATSTTGAIYIAEQGRDLTLNDVHSATDVSIDAGTNAIFSNPSTSIVGNALTLNGSQLGTDDAHALNTQVSSLSANSAGGLYITNNGALTLTKAVGGSGAADVQATGGALTVDTTVTGSSASLTTSGAGNNLDLTLGAVNVGTGSASLRAPGGTILFGATPVTANSLTLSATSLGAAGTPLSTQASIIDATATAGSIYIKQSGATTVTANATGGDVDVETTAGSLTINGATGNAINLVAGGVGSGLVVNGAVSGGLGVMLTAGAGGAIHINSPVLSTGGSLLINGSGGAISIDGSLSGAASGVYVHAGSGGVITSSQVVTATGPNGGVVLATGDGGSVTLDGTVSAPNGQVNISGGNNTPVVINNSVTAGAQLDIAAGDGGSLTLNGAINAGANAAILGVGTATPGGAVIVGPNASVTADVATLVGSSVGSSANPLPTHVNKLISQTTSGLFVSQTGSLNVEDVAGGPGSVTIAVANGDMTVFNLVANGAQLSTTTAGKSINVTSDFDVFTGDASLTATGDITVGPAAAFTAGNAVLNAGGAITTGSGSSFTAINPQLTAGGDIAIGQTSTFAATGTAGLTAGGAITTGSGTTLTAGTAALAGASIGSASNTVALNAGSAAATATAGSVYLSNTGAVSAVAYGGDVNASTTTGAVDATANNGSVSISTGGGDVHATANGGNVSVSTGGGTVAANATGGGVAVTSSGALTVNSVAGTGVSLATGASDLVINGAVDAKGGDATVTAGTGHVSGSGTITANTLNITADNVSGSTGGTGLATHINTLNGTATEGLGISNTGALAVATATGHDVLLASTGAISANSGVAITGNTVTLNGTTLGTSGTRLATNAGSINATATNGGIYITEADAAQFTGSATGAAVDVKTTNGTLTVGGATGTSVTLASGGTGSGLSIGGIVDAGSGNVTLTAGNSGSGAITMTGGQVRGAVLTANATGIGTSAAPLLTKIATLNATAGSGGVFVSEADDLALAAITSAGDVGIKNSTGNLTVQSLTGANVSLTASGGSIVDDGNDTTAISGNALTLSAQVIGAPSTLSGTTLNVTPRLDTNVSSLTATSTSGGIYVDQAKGLQAADLNASGGANGNIELLVATGDLNLHSVSASHTLLLAAGGNIFAAPGLGNIAAQQAELRAGTADGTAGHIGTLAQPLTFSLPTGNNLRLYVPSTIDSKDSIRSPSTLTSPGINTTLTLFTAPDPQAALAGFGQFSGFGETQFTSALESLIKTIQGQTGNVQGVLNIDWGSFDPNVSLFGTLDPAVCLPGDQRDEEGAKGGC
ncbi:MAG TPA: filamentous hemagglutinin N-terminal domain-containing protein [Steroidobacteraceae bacterium]|jgi:filamentous hemagglutinin family protein